MPKYSHPDVLTYGPNFIKTNCNKLVLVSTYALLDSYATVMANLLAESAMTSGDFTFSTVSNNVLMTTASGKTDASANTSGTASHHAFVDTVNSKVLWVTPESSGQSVTSGNPVVFPSLVYTSNQPT